MKALLVVAAFATLSTAALAGAPSSQQAPDTAAPVAVIADAGPLGAPRLTALSQTDSWESPRHPSGSGNPFAALADDIDPGTALLGLGLLALAVSRIISRLARRQEQQRRATALASTLEHAPRA